MNVSHLDEGMNNDEGCHILRITNIISPHTCLPLGDSTVDINSIVQDSKRAI